MIPLLILGLLQSHPKAHGYELLRYMKDNHFKYFVSCTKGSFYYNLQRLEDSGWILQHQPNDNKGRDKKCYTITSKGVTHFESLVLQYGSDTDTVNLTFYTVLMFEKYVKPCLYQKLIETQIQQIETRILRLENSIANANQQSLDPAFVDMMQNAVEHHKVNLKWFQTKRTT